jgi:hypothetical protein
MCSAQCKEAIENLMIYLQLTPPRIPDKGPSRLEIFDPPAPAPPCIEVVVSTVNIYRKANFG